MVFDGQEQMSLEQQTGPVIPARSVSTPTLNYASVLPQSAYRPSLLDGRRK